MYPRARSAVCSLLIAASGVAQRRAGRGHGVGRDRLDGLSDGGLRVRRASPCRWTAPTSVPGTVNLSVAARRRRRPTQPTSRSSRWPAARARPRSRSPQTFAEGAGARDRRPRPAGLRPARHRRLGRAELQGAAASAAASSSSPRAAPTSSAPRAASTARPTRSPTSRRCASPAATPSSCSSASATGPRSPRTTRRPTPATSRRSCSTASCCPRARTRSSAPR